MNYLHLCIFHNTLVTCTHFTLPGLETLCNQLLSWPSSWTLPWAQQAVCWSLFMTFLYSMQSFLWRASYQSGILTQFAHPVSLHLAESSLSSVHQDFLEILGHSFSHHQQMLTANSCFSVAPKYWHYSSCTEIHSIQMNQQGVWGLDTWRK